MEGILNFLYGEHHKIDPKNYKDVLEAAAIFDVPFATTFFKDVIKEGNSVPHQCNDYIDDNKEVVENSDQMRHGESASDFGISAD